jgi:hypothetical protein
MSSKNSSWNQIMQYSFLHVFANDATIDAHEMAMLERLALQDGQVDDHERAVLSRVFGRVNPDTVTADVWSEIDRFKAQYRIP